MASSIWFWQRIVSPHMARLASALADQGFDVTYVAEKPMSSRRVAQGWQIPDLGRARLIFAEDVNTTIAVAQSASDDSVHICQGLRGNGFVAAAQARLAKRGLRQWVVMEAVEDGGWRGFLRRLEYSRLVAKRKREISGYLAIGYKNSAWLMARGAPANQVFPFAYFLSDILDVYAHEPSKAGVFRLLFVGRFVELKRLDLLLRAVAALGRTNVELHVVGAGPLEEQLRQQGEELLGPRLHWIGGLPSGEVAHHMRRADAVVLPSRYDGWGAVVSEAIMVGTPVICSDGCGSAGVVRASGAGGVFEAGDLKGLVDLLGFVIDEGPLSIERREALAQWGGRLGARTGAAYLREILAFSEGCGNRPVPPWEM